MTYVYVGLVGSEWQRVCLFKGLKWESDEVHLHELYKFARSAISCNSQLLYHTHRTTRTDEST